LTIAEREQQREETADKITAEDPRIKFGGRQIPLLRCGDVDEKGASDGEQPGGDAVTYSGKCQMAGELFEADAKAGCCLNQGFSSFA
jgi:hypothetical protein